MKVLGIIILSIAAILSAVLFLLSSMCAVASGAAIGIHTLGAVFALLFLAGAIAAVKLIVNLSRDK
jgi:hypothetical protein